MTQTEFLLDMLKYYCENTTRRCVDDMGACRYHPSSIKHLNSEGCAIGRQLPEELALKFDSYEVPDVESIFEELPSDIQSLGMYFLTEVQRLHDLGKNWDIKKGLSVYGKIRVSDIIKEYELDETVFADFLN